MEVLPNFGDEEIPQILRGVHNPSLLAFVPYSI